MQKPITIRLGAYIYHPVPVGKDGLFDLERKTLKQLNKQSNSKKYGKH